MDVQVDNLSVAGLIKDLPPQRIPPEAFTSAMNMRFVEQKAKRIAGRTAVFGTPTVAPYFLLPVKSAAESLFWVYCSLTKAYVYAAGVHTDISRLVGGNYGATAARDWNATVHGGIPIINSGNDDLQYWATVAAATHLAILPNWTVGDRTRVIRSLGPHLVALNFSTGGGATLFPHGVRWSHPSDPGSVPTSWDYTDETVDAGIYELPDASAGVILDGLGLRGQMFIYKEGSAWSMRFIGGRPVFAFNQFLGQSGILATRCVGVTGDGKYHFCVSQDDIYIHDGSSDPISLVEERMRRTIFNNIDTTNYRNSFVFCHPVFKEMWFCYPEPGATHPTRALIWNYGRRGSNVEGVLSEAEVDFDAAAVGDTEIADTSWDSDALSWDSDTSPWGLSNKHQLLVANPSTTKILQLDSGTLYDTTAYTSTLARETSGFIGRKWDGSPIVDFALVKFVGRLWIEATGGPLTVRLGTQSKVDGAISWSDSQVFTPTTDMYLDFEVVGIAISVEFTATAAFDIAGYKFEMQPAGRFL